MAINHTINMTELQNINSWSTMTSFVNNASGNIFLPLMMFAIFFVLIFLQKRNGIIQAITISSAACFTLSIFFGVLGWIPAATTLMFFVLTLIFGFFMWIEQKH